MSTSTPHSHDPLDQVVVQALTDVHAQHQGLFTQVLVMVDSDVSFDDANSYRTAVKAAGSGGEERYSLTSASKGAHPRPSGISADEARLSSRDSEVAALQDAYDWIEGQGTQLQNVRTIHVLVVSNIGPCDACKKRLEYFCDDVVRLFDKHVEVMVDSVYDTAAAGTTMNRSGFDSTYGYSGATACTTASGKKFWRLRQEFRPKS
ncbi:hypothetical protein ACIBF7_21485 [Nonomuraea sp. NPDC050478]